MIFCSVVAGFTQAVKERPYHLRIPAKPAAFSRVNSPTDFVINSPMDCEVIPLGLPGLADLTL